jgi:hypothetical protein
LSRRACDALAILAALVVLAAVGHTAGTLLAYPWDWGPEEGLVLDYARRLVEAPHTLYGRGLIPSPSGYTPLLPLLLAPLVRASEEPLFGARVIALAWTAAVGLALFSLVRRRSGPVLGFVAVALVLAPRDFSVWFLLVRFDGLMIALWLGGAAALLPSRLERGADRLSSARLWTGAALLLASVLAKQTAVIHAAPLVLGWFLVDRRSAWRLTGAMLAGGLAALAALQLATDGGFLWIQRMWGVHPAEWPLFLFVVSKFVVDNGLLLALVVVAIALAWRRGERPFREGTWLLVLGGLAILPALAKVGAWTNYLLPLYCALVVLGARLWPQTPPAAVLVPAALGIALLARPFPLPTSADAATSAVLYDFVRERGRPILATRPEYAYFIVHQPVEVEGSSFPFLAAVGVPGMEKVLDRVRRRHYRVIVAVSDFWPKHPAFVAALEGYEIAAACTFAYYHGSVDYVVFVPRGEGARPPAFPAAARCVRFAAGPEGPAR